VKAILYPYPTTEGLELDVLTVEKDGGKLPIGNDQRARRQVWVRAEDEDRSRWSALDVAIAARLTQAAVTEIGADPNALSVSLVVRCPRTELRQSLVLDRSNTDPLGFEGRIHLERSFVAGVVQLSAVLTANVADHPNRFLGRSAMWTVLLDVADQFPTSGAIRVKWTDFKAKPPKIAELADYSDERFYVDANDEEPTLYLNESLPQLQQVLQDRIQRGPQRALRDVIATEVATKARLVLAETAAARIDEVDGVPQAPNVPWQAELLEQVLGDLPEEYAARGLAAFLDARKSAEAARVLRQLIGAVVERQVHAATATKHAVEEVTK
jgi:hypothetical protein